MWMLRRLADSPEPSVAESARVAVAEFRAEVLQSVYGVDHPVELHTFSKNYSDKNLVMVSRPPRETDNKLQLSH